MLPHLWAYIEPLVAKIDICADDEKLLLVRPNERHLGIRWQHLLTVPGSINHYPPGV